MAVDAVLYGVAIGAFFAVASLMVIERVLRRRRVSQLMAAARVPGGINSILDELDAAVVVLDDQREVVLASDRAMELGLVGMSRGVSTALTPHLPKRRGGSIGKHGVATSEVSFPCNDGTTRTLRLHFAQFGSRFLVLLATDLTEERRVEMIRREYVANISHELKTPTASIALISEAIAVAADRPDEVRRFQSRLSDEVARLGAITSDIIELSRLQSDGSTLAQSPVNMSQVVTESVAAHETIAANAKVKVVLATDRPAWVLGDQHALRVAMDNLLSNAILYSEHGGTVRVAVTGTRKWVSISFSDSGVGIASDDIDRVWERFYRVDPARSRNTGGSGLGLSIVKHAIRRHGGKVKVQSSLGRGSTFTVQLPAAEERS